MSKETKKRVIFDNYYSNGRYNAAADFLFEQYGEKKGWSSIEDVPESEVFAEMNAEETVDWEDFMASFEEFIGNNKFLIRGTVERWDGPAEGGFIFDTFSELSQAWTDCNYVKVWDENGHLYIECSHHNGSNSYEVRQLTERGEDYVSEHEYDMYPRELHDKLWDNNFLCKLPHYANKVWGCKKYEYAA